MVCMRQFAITSTLAITILADGDSSHLERLRSHQTQLVDCFAVFNVVGVELPNQMNFGPRALQMRDFFADHVRLHFEVISGREPSSSEMNDLISTALDRFKTMHRNGGRPEELLPKCFAWQDEIFGLTKEAGLSELASADRATVKKLLITAKEPSASEVERERANTPAEITTQVRRAFELWGEREYITPREADEP